MADEKNGDYGAWSRVPTWDGSPLTWRTFRREMSWWLSSLDATATMRYNLAARWLLRQSGVERQRGEEFSPEDLTCGAAEFGTDPNTGESVEIVLADPFKGINLLLAALETMNGQSTLDKRGELRTQFYINMARRPGERVSDCSSRFRTAVSDLKAEGVTLPDTEVGCFSRRSLVWMGFGNNFWKQPWLVPKLARN